MRTRLLVIFAVFLGNCGMASVASAQACTGWNFSVYAGSWYDVQNFLEDAYMRGEDYDAACCGHLYFSTLAMGGNDFSTNDIEAGGSEEINPDGTPVYYGFVIGCPCLNATVGDWWGEDWLPGVHVTLDPSTAETAVGLGDIPVTATVSPSEFIPLFSWGGAGTTDSGNPLVRQVSTSSPGFQTATGLINGITRAAATVDVLKLRLFLFVDSDNQDDSASFRPGSNLDGSSVDVSVMTGGGQTVYLAAAYVDGGNQVVSPPPGVTAASFGLSQVSNYTGYAMNAGTSTDPDFALGSTSADFDGNYAEVELLVRDYGGYATATTSVGNDSDSIRMPLPRNPSLTYSLPMSWVASGNAVSTAGTTGDDDEPDSASGGVGASAGDGFSWWDEFRGAVVQGQHHRLNPAEKDLFVLSEFPDEGVGYASSLPLRTWLVDSSERGSGNRINFNNSISVYQQRILQVIDAGWNSLDNDDKFGVTYVISSSVGPNAVVFDDVTPNPGPGPLRIFTDTIRYYSPSHTDPGIPDDIDTIAVSKTIAHEIGHGVSINHVRVDLTSQNDPICSPTVSPNTVMVWGANPSTGDTSHPCWVNIPDSYRQVDIDQMRLR